ncbi:cobalamin (vitamin B12) biosynthesis CbiG protein CbiG [Clostridium aceticum]|uniref:Cobalamin (Vitamin B12) biosynthesis CbiG protein CbiG n=1 Tax=Clostridium aceticum TaxID=84022 RepID=A0A0D8IA77_9CLOT|nr:cobalt-precorrin 5A hydrolase [Clostridium aceticum]AKL93581.1 cobalamin (vitamin B12) biosynthesis CbiG protein CbiG [Clostridium aceticum]KJF27173.1 hypothetical protein TZ02_08855 [Clostridium aceticum]
MKVAILTVTKGGRALGLQLKSHLPQSQLYVLPKFYEGEEGIYPIDPDLKTLVGEIFHTVDQLIFIMATGIVVRHIAPHLRDKRQDPGVLVIDEKGTNVISLLSGHIGGANSFTLKIADLLGANPVITTASDVRETMAVDTLAQSLGCRITDWQLTKKITAHIVNGGKVGIYWDKSFSIKLPESYENLEKFDDLYHQTYGIYVGNRCITLQGSNLLQLYTQNIVIGIGCRRGIDAATILEEIKSSLKEVGKRIESLKKLVTVDVKKDEEGLLEAARILNIPLEIIERQKIAEVEGLFQASSFVKETIGVGSVSEPCAYLGSGGGNLILKKRKNQGVTISIAEEEEGR